MRISLVLLFCILSLCIKAQPVLPVAGFQHALLLFNPACAGANDEVNIAILHKNQWASFPGSPSLYALSLHTPFNYGRLGAGMNLQNESAGHQNFLYWNGNFSYKINFMRGKLSMGAKAGLMQWSDRTDKLLIKDDGETIERTTRIIPDIGAGLFYKDALYTGGISAGYVPGIYAGNATTGKMYYQFSFGKTHPIGQHFLFQPSLLFRYTTAFSPQLTLSAPIEYKKTIWAGLSYRNTSVLTLMMGLNLNQLFHNQHDFISLFYYCDYSAGSTRALGNAHELMLLFRPGKSRNIASILKKRTTVNPLYFD